MEWIIILFVVYIYAFRVENWSNQMRGPFLVAGPSSVN